MAADPFFRMKIEDVFSIRGRGTVVVGRIESGILKAGDEVQLEGVNTFRKVVVSGIEAFHKVLSQAAAGQNVGLLLADVNRDEVHRGDILTG